MRWMPIAFLEQNIESIKQDELRDKALKKLLKAAEITDQFETRIAGDVARIEDSLKANKEKSSLPIMSIHGENPDTEWRSRKQEGTE